MASLQESSPVTKREITRDPDQANHNQDQSPYSFEAKALSPHQHHQPMYRKRETKPGQKEKEKRVLKKTPNSPSSRKKHGTNNHNATSNNAIAKPKPPNKSNQNKNTPKKKSKKQNVKTKKKKSILAFWFCMSSNTDAQDRSSQAPVTKSPKLMPSIEQKRDSLDRHTILETPTEILATKHSRRNANKRHSAPPSSEWTRIVTKAIVESPSQPPRSRTPTGGVRYRYDGTLERPYVYPGGLTFQSGGDKNRRHYVKMPDGRSNTSFCDTTLEDGSQFAHYDKYDDFDINSKFYLRFDYDPTDNSYSKDRRLSMPPDLDGEHKRGGEKLHSPTLEAIRNHSCIGKSHGDSYSQDQNVIYDVPYESDSDKEDENEAEHEDGDGKRNSYYSKPLQNSGCIYMWHSCEDLQHCEEKYHSKDGINRICENCNGNTPPRCHKDIHTGYGSGGDHISVSSSPITSAGLDTNTISCARKMSLPVELTFEYPLLNSTQGISNSGQQAHVSCDDTLGNNNTQQEGETIGALLVKDYSDVSSYVHSQREDSKLPDQSNQNDSPFIRGIGRSSCMPGNKRFFLPPPPCYTPPKEEMEAALTTIRKVSCHCGSQTDLTEDVDEVDMEDRDLSLKRQELQSRDVMMLQMARLSLDAETSTSVVTDKHEPENKRRDLQFYKEMSNPLILSKPTIDTNESLTKSESNQNTKPAQSVITSTPKPTRRSAQPGGDFKVFSGPKPLPRKRIPSKDSAVAIDATQPAKVELDNQMTDSLLSTPVLRQNKAPPVPKKRRSQMIEPDLTYTSADIEKVLAECKDDTLPRGDKDPNAINVRDDKHLQNFQNSRGAGERQTTELNASGLRWGPMKPLSSQMQSTPSKDNQNQINTSPEHRCRLNSSLGSSIDGVYHLRRFSAMSPSLDNMVDVFQEMTYDPDNEDNCNADDEMSIHNEDISFGSASVQNLLRSRSIFDRSLAVTRKRRQRLRDRKCHSQLLSSADIDEYDNSMSKKHLWKVQKYEGRESRVPGFHLPIGDNHFLQSQLLMQRNLWKHSYTDSGNDSDMMSPIDVRYHRQVEDAFQEIYPSGEAWKKVGNRGGVKDSPEKKSWEARLRVKHELRKARSIEHLFLAHEVQNTKKPSLETCV